MTEQDETNSGRLTFAIFFAFGVVFACGAMWQVSPEIPYVGIAGFVVFTAVGAIIGGLIGAYNMGRKKR